MAERPGFLERLKRHHMFQIASGYATVAYAIVLVANAVFPDIGLNRGQVRYVIAALALGFPLALVLGWTFIPPTQENEEWRSRWQRLRWRIAPIVSVPAVLVAAISGLYLWHLDERYGDVGASTSAAQAVAILPFDHAGTVDDAFMQGLAEQLQTSFSSLGVRLIANDSSPVLADSKAPVADVAKATGATLVIRGSVQRADPNSEYEVYFELISATDGVALDTLRRQYSPKADPADIQTSIASSIAERVHFLGVLDHYFAPGYRTTKDAGALQLFRRGMLTYLNQDYLNGMQMLRAAVKLDPGFAQAHAYIAYYEAANPDPGLADPKALVDQEIAAAESRAPGLPEAALARASSEFNLDDNPDAALNTLKPVAQALANSFNVHMLQGVILRRLGRGQDALREYRAAEELDPYNLLAAQHAAKLDLALRDYDDTRNYLGNELQRWPLASRLYLDRAQVELSQDGDLTKFAKVVDGDFDPFGTKPTWAPLALDRLEVAHFLGKHAEVISGLKSIALPVPGGCPNGDFEFPQLSVQDICVAPFTAESLRLLGKDREAADFARLHAPEFVRLLQDGNDPFFIVNLALLQAFGGDAAALKTLEPILKSLDKPVDHWTAHDGTYSLDVAVVLAWCGQTQQALDLLSKSLDAPFGAEAALVARDPVWRPLYKSPAFAALLAAHGQTLTRAP